MLTADTKWQTPMAPEESECRSSLAPALDRRGALPVAVLLSVSGSNFLLVGTNKNLLLSVSLHPHWRHPPEMPFLFSVCREVD